MINENIGIRMCKHKQTRKKYGTIVYNPTVIVLEDPRIHYDEIHQLVKKENKKKKKETNKTKKIDIRVMTKEEQIDKLIDLSDEDKDKDKDKDKDEDENEKKNKESLKFKEEPINRPTVEEKQAVIAKEEKQEKQNEEKKTKDKENKNMSGFPGKPENAGEDTGEDTGEDGGESKKTNSTKRKIYITDISVDRDKEMFQL